MLKDNENMKIEFTNHAREKSIILSQHNFVIEEKDVTQAILQPSKVKTSRKIASLRKEQ